jgi:hypothetical protein
VGRFQSPGRCGPAMNRERGNRIGSLSCAPCRPRVPMTGLCSSRRIAACMRPGCLPQSRRMAGSPCFGLTPPGSCSPRARPRGRPCGMSCRLLARRGVAGVSVLNPRPWRVRCWRPRMLATPPPGCWSAICRQTRRKRGGTASGLIWNEDFEIPSVACFSGIEPA